MSKDNEPHKATRALMRRYRENAEAFLEDENPIFRDMARATVDLMLAMEKRLDELAAAQKDRGVEP